MGKKKSVTILGISTVSKHKPVKPPMYFSQLGFRFTVVPTSDPELSTK